ncbi:MAG: CoA pyrophosphatase [Pseudomonadales bacterium]|nr:CoA pyrophosphatase [Pseudomonadales bacterium]
MNIEIDLPRIRPTLDSVLEYFGTHAEKDPEPMLNPDDITAGVISTTGKKDSAVLIPLYKKDGELRIMLNWRSANLRSHAGQICFPGGRVDQSDADCFETALRETHEEVGLNPANVRILGKLGKYYTQSGYSITPVVGYIEAPGELQPNPDEVAAILEPPLDFFTDSSVYEIHRRTVGELVRSYYSVTYDGYVIWGATCAIIVDLYKRLANHPPTATDGNRRQPTATA